MRTDSYLSEEELNALIYETEQRQVIAPPTYLEEEILQKIRAKKQKTAKREFYLYTAKIITAIAAVITLMFAAPQTMQQSSWSFKAMEVQRNVSKQKQEYRSVIGKFGSMIDVFYSRIVEEKNDRLQEEKVK